MTEAPIKTTKEAEKYLKVLKTFNHSITTTYILTLLEFLLNKVKELEK